MNLDTRLDEMLEALNDSDVGDRLGDVTSDISCAESAKSKADFFANIGAAIVSAEALIKALRDLKHCR
jgi:hypothetical protein